jgi:hypothetical protein
LPAVRLMNMLEDGAFAVASLVELTKFLKLFYILYYRTKSGAQIIRYKRYFDQEAAEATNYQFFENSTECLNKMKGMGILIQIIVESPWKLHKIFEWRITYPNRSHQPVSPQAQIFIP